MLQNDEVVWAIFNQGYKAFRAGQHRGQCPYSYLPDAEHWATGYDSARIDQEVEEMEGVYNANAEE
jgi:ribosome modulation factor